MLINGRKRFQLVTTSNHNVVKKNGIRNFKILPTKKTQQDGASQDPLDRTRSPMDLSATDYCALAAIDKDRIGTAASAKEKAILRTRLQVR